MPARASFVLSALPLITTSHPVRLPRMHLRRSIGRRLAIITVLGLSSSAVSCRKRTAIEENLSRPVSSSAARSTATEPSPASSSSAAPKARQHLNDAERTELATYLKALTAGRRATKAAKYEDAVSAFNTALTARPNDPRAYAERGYAALLAKDYTGAEADLVRAAQGTKDRVLRAQIFYNLGLVREANGRDANSAFTLSNFLHGSAAAQKKLVGKEACHVEIDRSPNADEVTKYRDWLAFYAAYQDAFFDSDAKPDRNETARQQLCGRAGCNGAGRKTRTQVHRTGFGPVTSIPTPVQKCST